MNKTDPPTSFGVFKPVGHTVVAFASADNLKAASADLLAQGFKLEDMVTYTAQEMLAQVAANLLTASPMASVGQELNLVKAHQALAQQGCSFLVVQADDEPKAGLVDAVLRSHHATSAQRYGRFLIEELVEQVPGETQVFESPDRGLDLDVAKEK